MKPAEGVLSCASPIHIAAACDDAYAMPLAVMLRSLADSLEAGRSVVAHVIFETLSPAARERLQASIPSERVQIRWTPMDIAGLPATATQVRAYDHISQASYFRLLLPDLLPLELSRVIYLDCDLVVVGDIGELWRIDLGDSFAAAVPELAADSRLVSSAQGIRLWRELGLGAGLEQFNAGVLLINLAKWRSELVSQRAMVYLTQAAEWLRWHDQEALNAVFAGDWLRLDAAWNVTMRQLMKGSTGNCPPPHIIHYHTAAKPWHAGYPFAMQEVFFAVLDRTAWAGWRPARAHFGGVRRIGERVVKALRKRRHTFRRLRTQGAKRFRGARLFASWPKPLVNPPPKDTGAAEVRIFMVAGDCTPLACTLAGRYLDEGSDRIMLAVDAGAAGAWRSFAGSHDRIHVFVKNALSDDEILRMMLHRYGQGCWCLLTRSDEWLRFPCDDLLSLKELTQILDARQRTALVSRRVELFDAERAAVAESGSGEPRQFCGFWLPDETVRKLPMTERDTVRNRVFVADNLIVPGGSQRDPHAASRSAVSLLKYTPEMLIGPGARSVHGARLSDIEGVTLCIPWCEQARDVGRCEGPLSASWRELEAAGLLRAPESLQSLACASLRDGA